MNIMQPPTQQANTGGGTAVGPAENQDHRQFQLSRTELERALEIKQAVERDERIQDENITDFEFVQWSLTTVDFPVEDVVEKVFLMQCFREEYNIQSTIQQCAELWSQLTINLLPGCYVSFDYEPKDKCYAVVLDLSKFNPGMIQTEQDYKVWLGGLFYLWEGASQNFETMRNGLSEVNECFNAGFSLSDVISNQKVLNRLMHDFFLNYPKNDREYYFVNSATAVNCWCSFIKHLLPPQRRNAYNLGRQILVLGGRSLATLYHVPSEASAAARTRSRICEALEVRYQNQARFSFSDSAKFVID